MYIACADKTLMRVVRACNFDKLLIVSFIGKVLTGKG